MVEALPLISIHETLKQPFLLLIAMQLQSTFPPEHGDLKKIWTLTMNLNALIDLFKSEFCMYTNYPSLAERKL